MKITKKIVAQFITGTTLLALLLTGCTTPDSNQSSAPSPSQGTSTPQSSSSAPAGTADAPEKTELRMAITVDPDGLDPQRTAAASTFQITNNIYDTLVRVNQDGSLAGGLAESWDIAPDGMSITFHLREGVNFHNGVPCDAQAVASSFERLKDEESPRAADYANFTITAADAATVEVTMETLDVVAVSNFAYPWSAIVEVGAADTLKNKPVGTGPYTLGEWIPQQSLTLTKNADYYAPAMLETISFKLLPDATAQISSLQNGELDIIAVSGEQVATFESDASFKVLTTPGNALQLMAMNLANPALSDIRVRQAINYAVDKDALIEAVWWGYGEKIGSHFPTGLKEYEDHSSSYGYDVEQAKALLDEAGYADGFSLEMYLPKNYPAYVNAGQVIADSLAQIGITCNIHVIEWAEWLSDVYSGRNYDLTVVGHTGRLDPYVLLARYDTASGENYFNYSNAEVDQLLTAYRSETDETKRTEIIQSVQAILAEEVPAYYIQTPISTYVTAADVAGFGVYPIDIYEMKDVFFE